MGYAYKNHFCTECVWHIKFQGKTLKRIEDCFRDDEEGVPVAEGQKACRRFIPMKHPESIVLYPHGIKGANKLPTEDLRQLAKFNKVVMNSIKMDRMLNEK